MQRTKIKHWSHHAILPIPEGTPLPGQDRLFVRQIKKGGRYGYIKLDDARNKKYIIHTIGRDEAHFIYDTIQDLEKAGWVLN